MANPIIEAAYEEIMDSLLGVIQKAGGSITFFTSQQLKHMSAHELLELLAPNNFVLPINQKRKTNEN